MKTTTRRTSATPTRVMPKPRNPFAALARSRSAGSHRPGGRTLRQQARQALAAELKHVTATSP